MASGMSADEGMPGLMKDMAGSYTGPALHLEKPGTLSGEHSVFACLSKVKGKDDACAGKIIELLKAQGLTKMDAQEGLLGYTVMQPKNMLGPLPKDDLMIYWIEVFKTREDFSKQDNADLIAKVREHSDVEITTYEFAETKHFQK